MGLKIVFEDISILILSKVIENVGWTFSVTDNYFFKPGLFTGFFQNLEPFWTKVLFHTKKGLLQFSLIPRTIPVWDF